MCDVYTYSGWKRGRLWLHCELDYLCKWRWIGCAFPRLSLNGADLSHTMQDRPPLLFTGQLAPLVARTRECTRHYSRIKRGAEKRGRSLVNMIVQSTACGDYTEFGRLRFAQVFILCPCAVSLEDKLVHIWCCLKWKHCTYPVAVCWIAGVPLPVLIRLRFFFCFFLIAGVSDTISVRKSTIHIFIYDRLTGILQLWIRGLPWKFIRSCFVLFC